MSKTIRMALGRNRKGIIPRTKGLEREGSGLFRSGRKDETALRSTDVSDRGRNERERPGGKGQKGEGRRYSISNRHSKFKQEKTC